MDRLRAQNSEILKQLKTLRKIWLESGEARALDMLDAEINRRDSEFDSGNFDGFELTPHARKIFADIVGIEANLNSSEPGPLCWMRQYAANTCVSKQQLFPRLTGGKLLFSHQPIDLMAGVGRVEIIWHDQLFMQKTIEPPIVPGERYTLQPLLRFAPRPSKLTDQG